MALRDEIAAINKQAVRIREIAEEIRALPPIECDRELQALKRECSYACYRNRRLHGEGAAELADAFPSNAASFEVRYQVDSAVAAEEWGREQARDAYWEGE